MVYMTIAAKIWKKKKKWEEKEKRKENTSNCTACWGAAGKETFSKGENGNRRSEEGTGGSCSKMRKGGKQRTARDVLDEKLVLENWEWRNLLTTWAPHGRPFFTFGQNTLLCLESLLANPEVCLVLRLHPSL